MVNSGGLIYRIFAVGVIFLLFAVLLFCIRKYSNSKKVQKTEAIIALVIAVYSLFYIGFYTYKAFSPDVQYHDGYISREYRASSVAPPLPFTMAYVFTDSDNLKPTFYLDSFSRKEICPQGFDKDVKYRVYYEKDTNIILAVEVIR